MNPLLSRQNLNLLFLALLGFVFLFVLSYKFFRNAKVRSNAQKMVRIESGVYPIGCPEDTLLRDLRKIPDIDIKLATELIKEPRLEYVPSGFYLDEWEVTNDEYLWFSAFMNWFNGDVRSIFAHPDAPADKDYRPKYQSDAKFNDKDQPVVGIDWFDAYAFARFTGRQLPTEKQWEYACRNGGKTIYPWGNTFQQQVANIDNDDFFTPVSQEEAVFLQGKTEQFLYHMAGNVAEWTDSYLNKNGTQTAFTRGGGCYQKPGSIYSLCYVGILEDANHRENDIGMRLMGYTPNPERLTYYDFLDHYQQKRQYGDPFEEDNNLGFSGEVNFRFINYEFCREKIDSIRGTRKMRFVPSGSYVSGSPSNNKLLSTVRASGTSSLLSKLLEKEPITKESKTFYMDSTEVTNAEYQRFLNDWLARIHWYAHPLEPAGKDYLPKFWTDSTFNQPDQPVVGVDWWDAYAYANWAGKRLPTREEWEIAARTGQTDYYPWGNEFVDSISVTQEIGFKHPKPVKQFSMDQTPSRLYDMGGNVSEWTVSPDEENPGFVFLKGGNYLRKGRIYSILFLDEKANQDMRHQSVGFRCAMDGE